VVDVIPMVEWKKTPTSSLPRGPVHLQVIQLGTLCSSWSKVVPCRHVGVWHLPFVVSSTVERASLFVSLSFVVTVRYDSSLPFLEGTFIYHIYVVTVDWLILCLSSLLSLSPRLTFVYYAYCSCRTLFWSKEESTIIVLCENYSLAIQYTQQ